MESVPTQPCVGLFRNYLHFVRFSEKVSNPINLANRSNSKSTTATIPLALLVWRFFREPNEVEVASKQAYVLASVAFNNAKDEPKAEGKLREGKTGRGCVWPGHGVVQQVALAETCTQARLPQLHSCESRAKSQSNLPCERVFGSSIRRF